MAAWLLGALLGAALSCAHAADYPTKPIRLVVPFPAGGTTDVLGRLLAQQLTTRLGQQIIVDNRPGAGGGIGADVVAKSAGDGYTLLLGAVSTHSINPSLYAKLPYDAVKDFVPISLVGTLPNVLVVNPGVPAKSVLELVTMAKKQPGTLTFASGGNGTTHHLAGELFQRMAGVQMTHVPYKGNAPAITDVIGGQVSMMFDNINNSLPHIKGNKLLPLAVTGATRSPVLPNVPTLAEQGYPGFNITSWFGLFAPAGTPQPVVAKLNAAVIAATHDKQVRDLLASEGIEAQGNTLDQFRTFLQAESTRWAKIVKDSGAHVD
jgi:tripartite-type tricarboxylate transporter receptor subunit TctC